MEPSIKQRVVYTVFVRVRRKKTPALFMIVHLHAKRNCFRYRVMAQAGEPHDRTYLPVFQRILRDDCRRSGVEKRCGTRPCGVHVLPSCL